MTTADETERQRAAIRRLRPGIRLDGKPADWIAGVYASLTETRGDVAGPTDLMLGVPHPHGGSARGVIRFDAADPTLDPKTVASADIIAKARIILGPSYDPTGKTEAEIMRAAISTRLGAAATSAKSDEYLRAALDVAADMVSGRMDQRDAGRRSVSNPRQGVRTPEQQARADAGRDCRNDDLQRAWMTQHQRTDAEARGREDQSSDGLSPYERSKIRLQNAWQS